MGITRGGLDGEDTTRDVQEGDIESSSSEIEDEDVLLGLRLAVETVGDGSSGGFVDDTEDLETSDGTSILGGETLRVIEVGGDAGEIKFRRCTVDGDRIHSRDNSLLDLFAKLSLRDLLHLGEDHGRDFLGGEGLVLAEVGDLDEGGAILLDHLEGPVGHVLQSNQHAGRDGT